MKKFLVCSLACLSAVLPPACRANELIDPGSYLGAGAMAIESPYKGVDDDVYPVPVLILESNRFFVDSTIFGFYLSESTEPLRWAVIGSLRSQGYEGDDSADLNGMEDRDWAFDSGVRMSWKNKIVDLAVEAVADVSGTYEGQELRLGVSKRLFEGFLIPKASVRWQSRDLTDYYYGVRQNEARAGRPAYTGHSGLEYMAGITAGLPLGGKWALFADAECTFLGDEAADSPITGDDSLMRYVAGVVYRF